MTMGACAQAPRDPLAGDYRVAGGGAPLETFQALSAGFSKQHPGAHWTFEDVGSNPGIALVAGGDIDLGTSSAEPSADYRDRVKLVPIGVSGTAVVVSASNPVTALRRDQVRDIFSGKITDWGLVGGNPGGIFLVIRNAGSAIRENFDAYFFDGKATYPADAVELSDIDQTLNAVTGRAGVISMITINERTLGDSRIRLVVIDGVPPTKASLANGSYRVRRPLYLVFNPDTVKPAIRAFLDFVQGPQGQQIIAAAGAG